MIWEILSIFGEGLFWIGIALIFLVYFFIAPKKMKKQVFMFSFSVLLAVTISFLVVYGMKAIFKISRPCLGLPDCPENYSFPSGHAAVIFAVATTLAFHYKDKRLGIMLFILGCFVAISRLMIGVHTIEDIIGGSMIGIVIGILVNKANENYQKEIKEIVSEIGD